jgi:hypothetical protein
VGRRDSTVFRRRILASFDEPKTARGRESSDGGVVGVDAVDEDRRPRRLRGWRRRTREAGRSRRERAARLGKLPTRARRRPLTGRGADIRPAPTRSPSIGQSHSGDRSEAGRSASVRGTGGSPRLGACSYLARVLHSRRAGTRGRPGRWTVEPPRVARWESRTAITGVRPAGPAPTTARVSGPASRPGSDDGPGTVTLRARGLRFLRAWTLCET